MKTKLFTGLVLAAALLIGEPAMAATHHAAGRGARGHAVAAIHRGGGSRAIAATHRGRAFRASTVASRRALSTRAAARSFASNTRSTTVRSRSSFAFGGTANSGHGRYAFASHQGWNHGSEYFWNGHHYRWYGNGWFIIDPFPYYGYGYYAPGYYGNGGSVSMQVQAALTQQGYYQGPVDGVVGPGTRAAIAAYQRDNGLRVTGTITGGLLNDLGVG